IVFADRTSQAYVLLLKGRSSEAPSREDLQALVRKELPAGTDAPEVELLVQLIGTEPVTDAREAERRGERKGPSDLLGFHVEVVSDLDLPKLVATDLLMDPVLVRELSPAERASLAERRHALLLRADYRNQHAVRGLRLLQTLVRLVAKERGALVHDPDTGETMGVEAFTRRRLQAGLGNIADQVAIVPFGDKLHGEPFVRLTTRGMRRFGSFDLELDGLPRDEKVLQQATFLLHGLALQMVRAGEIDSSGFAVELDEEIEITRTDITQAYARQQGAVPPCADCVGHVDVHLVEREAEPHDPQNHLVVRVVAPRPVSDARDYDHPAWVRTAITKLLGPAG
ncbi:MAG TPA: hypothetical protein VFG69_02420, partial [Nannocystaceae bacterium]|nr:hypothetical protein [Nannocystaceae bacterium]